MPADVDDYDDPTETLRLVLIGIGIAANLAIVYWQMKDTPEMVALRARLRGWWAQTFTNPARLRRELHKAEAETVFEAIQVVEGGMP